MASDFICSTAGAVIGVTIVPGDVCACTGPLITQARATQTPVNASRFIEVLLMR